MNDQLKPSDLEEYPVSQAQELLALHKALWEVTSQAIALQGKYPLSAENEKVGKQLGRLIRVLARHDIAVIDETTHEQETSPMKRYRVECVVTSTIHNENGQVEFEDHWIGAKSPREAHQELLKLYDGLQVVDVYTEQGERIEVY